MECEEFVRKVREMRSYQKEISRLRKKGEFKVANCYNETLKKIETNIDLILRNYINPEILKKIDIFKSNDYSVDLIRMGFDIHTISAKNKSLIYFIYKKGTFLGRIDNKGIIDFLLNHGYNARFIKGGTDLEFI